MQDRIGIRRGVARQRHPLQADGKRAEDGLVAGHPERGAVVVRLPQSAQAEPRIAALWAVRERCLRLGAELPWVERGAILALLGSAERAFFLIERIDEERRSVSRVVPVTETSTHTREAGDFGAAAVPA